MPLFDYRCQGCETRFEALVTADRAATCPACGGTQLEKQLSTFAVGAAARRAAPPSPGPCGSCGDPRGPGACSLE